MSEVFILIPGAPVGKGRPRIGKRGPHTIMFTPKETVAYEQKCAEEAKLSMGNRELMAGAVELKLQIFMPIPISYSKKKAQAAREQRLVPTKKPDGDNIIKAICDAFNGSVWVDDTQVVDYHVTKRFADEPCVIAIVTPLELESC